MTKTPYGRAVREDIIMMSLSMQGQTGLRADQPGLGNHLQAMSGLDYLTGRTCSTTRNSLSAGTISPASTRSWGRR